MYYLDKRRIHFLYLIVDILLVAVSYYLPYKYNPSLVAQNILGFKLYFPVFALWGISLIFLLNNCNLYTTDRSLSILAEWWLVIKCVLFSSVLAVLYIFALKIEIFSRVVFFEAIFLLAFSLCLWRSAKRAYVRNLIRKGYFNKNILIVGSGRAGVVLSEEIENNSYLGLKIIGFLDDTRTGEIGSYKVLGKIQDLETIVKRDFIDEIYITIPSERKVTSEVLLQAIKLGKTIRVVAERFDLPYRKVDLNYIGFIPLVTYFERGLHGTEQTIKRLFDFIGAGMILILLSPLFLIIGILIKLESPGPVFYLSSRCGKKGRIFNFYKFRSMINNADNYKEYLRPHSEVRGPIFKIKKDPRITRLGRLLRRYSLDELPQLINVLKGDMSLVGPRPFPVDESQGLEDKYMPRLNIKPGITGLAQIRGRSDLAFERWARWDLWYINNWSFGLDLRILWWTIPSVLKGKGAY
ncbi:MAG: sugar transferase [Candidatus Omnitrophica bacterium]|nr:sugar transferase [Candidatus Omnitrophota bacterium]